MPKNLNITLALGSLGLALALTMTGCSAPTVAPDSTAPAAPGDSTTDPNAPAPAPTQPSMIDPAYPWPSDIPRPSGVFYEFSSKNPLGEGALWQIDFHVSSVAEAQAYVDALVSAGWKGLLGQAEPMVDDDGRSVSWVLNKDAMMGTVTTEDAKASPIVMSFAIMGSIG